MDDRLNGWDEIAGYLHKHRRTAQRYVGERGLPVHHLPGGAPKSPVHAFRSEVDEWLHPGHPSATAGHEGFAEQMLQRVSSLFNAKRLYRQNYVVRFSLQRSGAGIQARIETEYDLVNTSDEKQPYVQEITVDHCERGYVEVMSVSVDGKSISLLKRPPATKLFFGYASYQGPRLFIEPSVTRKSYTGKATWIINRSDNDFWYLHVGIPTFRARVETSASPGFEITPPFSVPGLLMIGEHFDIAWKRRGRDERR